MEMLLIFIYFIYFLIKNLQANLAWHEFKLEFLWLELEFFVAQLILT